MKTGHYFCFISGSRLY